MPNDKPIEYISLTESIQRVVDDFSTELGSSVCVRIAISLACVPAADVAPIHRGEWVEFDGEGTYQCTYCGEPFMLMEGTPRDNEYNYCPKCGAYLREGMDGGEHHAE